MARGMVPACQDNRPRSSKENHPETAPDRRAKVELLGLIYGLTPFLKPNIREMANDEDEP